MGEPMRYYDLSKNLLSLIGLWPYENDRFRTLKNSLYSLTCFSFVFVQCMAIKTTKYAPMDIVKKLSCVIIFTSSFLVYNIRWFQLSYIKDVMNRMTCDWNTNNRETLQIIEKHASMGRNYGLRFIYILYSCGVCTILSHMTNSILDKVIPLNGSRLDNFPFAVEYFAFQEKCYLLTRLHIYTSVMLHITAYVATESFSIMCIQHISSLFDIASYYVREAIVNASKEFSDVSIRRDIAKAVTAHRKALKFYLYIVDNNEFLYSILIVFNIFAISCNLLRLSQSILVFEEIIETVICVFIISCELCYMFWMHYLVQCVCDTSDKLVPTIFQSNWYDISASSQKMLINIMLMCSKPVAITFFGFYYASMEGFSSLLRLSFSYFMVLSSMPMN